MKKIVIGIVMGVVVGTLTTVVASNLIASNVAYTPKDSTWNVNNVEDAIDGLYDKNNTIEYSINVFHSRGVTLWASAYSKYSKYKITGANCQSGGAAIIEGTNDWSNFPHLQVGTEYSVNDYKEVYLGTNSGYCTYTIKFY